jgi:hypothetical protein
MLNGVLGKLIVVQLVKEMLEFYETGILVTVFTLSSPVMGESRPHCYPFFLRLVLISSSMLC